MSVLLGNNCNMEIKDKLSDQFLTIASGQQNSLGLFSHTFCISETGQSLM